MPITSHTQNGVTGNGGFAAGGGATRGSDITVKVFMAGSLGTGATAFTCQK